LRFYLVDDDRMVPLLSWHQIQRDEEVVAALGQVKAAGLIPQEQGRLWVVADGARWIWERIHTLFPTAAEILDYSHCSQSVHALAAVRYAGHPDRAREGVEAPRARLFADEVAGVIWGVQRIRPATETAATAIAQLPDSLPTHQHRLPYGTRRKAGSPLGSGGIEAANTFTCHVRLKRSGAWWYVANSTHMLALRCAKYTGTSERVFERYRQIMLAKSQQKNVKK
jgi:hypothetical protein